MSPKVEKLYVEWADGRHEVRKLPVPASKRTTAELMQMTYDKMEDKPSEMIGWDADGMAVCWREFGSATA